MWNQITLDVPDDLKDALIGELSEHDVAGVWEDAADLPGATRLVAYFGCTSNIGRIERRIRELFARGSYKSPAISCTVVKEYDWTEEWKKSYTSFPIGDSFFVIPSWMNCSCPDDRL